MEEDACAGGGRVLVNGEKTVFRRAACWAQKTAPRYRCSIRERYAGHICDRVGVDRALEYAQIHLVTEPLQHLDARKAIALAVQRR